MPDSPSHTDLIDLSEQLQGLSQTGEIVMDPVYALDAMLTTEFTVPPACVGEGFVRRHHLLKAEYTVSYYLTLWK